MDEMPAIATAALLEGHNVYGCNWRYDITQMVTKSAPFGRAEWLCASSLEYELAISYAPREFR
jgi:hypothetical protein